MRSGFPISLRRAGAGQKIGLLGGSFDPAHQAHVKISKEALKRFDLDWVWWLVSPGNPLKEDGPAALDLRVAYAKTLVDHPRIVITDIERHLHTRYTARSLAALTRAYPEARFTWLMGSDNLVQFHRWKDWEEIMQMMPVGVLARPDTRMAARLSVAARRFAPARIAHSASHMLGRADAPAWCFADIALDPSSSSAIRARGDWPNSETAI